MCENAPSLHLGRHSSMEAMENTDGKEIDRGSTPLVVSLFGYVALEQHIVRDLP